MGMVNAIGFLCSLGPYLLVAWGYVELLNPQGSFWGAMAVLLGVRLFFSVIEFFGSVVAWRIYGRQHSIRTTLQFLSANKFPMRKYVFDDAPTYLFRIRDKWDVPDISDDTRGAARQIEGILDFLDEVTIVYAWRARSAFASALDIFAPAQKALYKDLDRTPQAQ